MEKTKASEAYEKIKSVILIADAEDQTGLSETYFADTLNMSRTPVRSALQRLQYEGFIRIIPQQGIVINELTYEDAKQIFDLRAAVENYLTRVSLSLLNDEDFAVMEEMLARQEKAVEEKDYNGFLEMDQAFHLYSYRHYDNKYMKNVLANCMDRLYKMRYKSITVPGRAVSSLAAHRNVLRLMREGDVDETTAKLREHLSFLHNMFLMGQL